MLLLVCLLAAFFCAPALAVTEAEVEAKVAASGKESVTGNVLIWFLCAVGFLKVSQKIDSFMASLGINVGRTGGSLLGEAMIAMRTVSMVMKGGGRAGGGKGASGSGSPSGGGSSGWFLKGGLAGMVNRHVTNSAVKTATTQTAAVNSAQHTVNQAVSGAAAQAAAQAGHRGNAPANPGGAAQAGASSPDGMIAAGRTQQAGSNEAAGVVNPFPPAGANGVTPALTPPDSAVIQASDSGAEGMPAAGMPVVLTPPITDDVSALDASSIQADDVPMELLPQDSGVIQMAASGEGSETIGSMPTDLAPPPIIGGMAEAAAQDGDSIQVSHSGSESTPAGVVSADSHSVMESHTGIGQPPTEGSSAEGGVLPAVAPSVASVLVDASQSDVIAPGADGIASDAAMIQMAAEDEEDHAGEAVPVETAPPIMDRPVPDSIPPDSPPVEGGPVNAPSFQQGVVVSTGEGATLHIPAEGSQPTPSGGGSSRESVTVLGGNRQSSSHSTTTTRTAQASSSTVHSQTHSSQTRTTQTPGAATVRPSLGGMIFSKSLASGGSFANDVIGTVARGEVPGSITGDMAAQSLVSYMGQTTMIGARPESIPYKEVEIGRGRITGTEIMPGHPDGISFAMYNAAQYAKPEDSYRSVQSADGQVWYKQYAVDTVKRTPVKETEGKVEYKEQIVKRMPKAPQRKDRM